MVLKTKTNILLIGNFSATGGVSVHLRRLRQLLSYNYNVSVIDESSLPEWNKEFFNFRTFRMHRYLRILQNSDIVHIHSTPIIFLVFHIFWSKMFFKKIITTTHSLTLVKNKSSRFKLTKLLQLVGFRIFVSNEIEQSFDFKSKYKVLEAFLPPKKLTSSSLPKEINALLDKNVGKIILCGNAYKLNIFNNQDLYGLDLLINLAIKIKSRKLPYFIIFIVVNPYHNAELLKKYKNRIYNNNLIDQIFIYEGSINFIDLIKASNIVIRPTNTDGDALTVREGIFLNKIVMASDVVKRPDETIIFKNRDVNDMLEKLMSIPNYKVKKNQNQKEYLNIYKKLYNSL